MTTNAWLSPVQIHDSALLGTTFEVNNSYHSGTPIVTMTISVQTEHPEKQGGLNLTKCVLGFKGVWHDSENADEIAFTITCSMGITVSIPDSAFGEGFPVDRVNRIVDVNAVSLAYGKVRSFIEDMTAQSSIGRQTIPAIEPNALLESFEE